MISVVIFSVLTIVQLGEGQFQSQLPQRGQGQQQPQLQQQRGDGQRGSGNCPERNGRFANPSQCDAYTQCEDGVATEELCPDGLLFNPKARFFAYPCQYPIEVDCSGRPNTQVAKATEQCPHSYGFYKQGDERSCGQFINCVEGRAYTFDCPEGLAFNPDTLQCDWPDLVPSCNAEVYLGFTCPAQDGAFSSTEFRSYRSPFDCGKYFVCLNGKPRLLTCPAGQGFDEETSTCQDANQVANCIFASGQEPSFSPPGSRRPL